MTPEARKDARNEEYVALHDYYLRISSEDEFDEQFMRWVRGTYRVREEKRLSRNNAIQQGDLTDEAEAGRAS